MKITIEMLKNKIKSHEERLRQIARKKEELDTDEVCFVNEIESFKQSIRILEDRCKE